MRTGCLAAIRRQQPALHFAVKRWISARDDQAPAGDDHPAAVLAADAGQPVDMGHLLRASQSEYAKLERAISAVEPAHQTAPPARAVGAPLSPPSVRPYRH